jgi:hypothetical protein
MSRLSSESARWVRFRRFCPFYLPPHSRSAKQAHTPPSHPSRSTRRRSTVYSVSTGLSTTTASRTGSSSSPFFFFLHPSHRSADVLDCSLSHRVSTITPWFVDTPFIASGAKILANVPKASKEDVVAALLSAATSPTVGGQTYVVDEQYVLSPFVVSSAFHRPFSSLLEQRRLHPPSQGPRVPQQATGVEPRRRETMCR